MAHTDSKGTDAYNLKLSQKRAESVVKYLLSKGIAPGRLKAKGYGETMPVVPNSNPDGTDNPLGRAKNRRTDFKIIGVIDAEIIIDSEVPD
jgi:outer membrane protein OmpA-like peptidoglycan-associated protein